jgi:hypothetical protein
VTWTSEEARQRALPPALSLLLEVIEGKPQLVDSGMRTNADNQAGRAVWRYPDLRQRIHAATCVLDKVMPSLRVAEVAATIDAHHTSEQPAEPRALARAIFAALSRATDDDADSETPTPWLDASGLRTRPALSTKSENPELSPHQKKLQPGL